MNLNNLRDKIDTIDNKMLKLLNERMEVVKAVGEFKNKNGGAIYRPEREIAIIDRLSKLNNGLLNKNAIEAIFLEIFAVSRNLELPEKVAYLGPEGSFTHQAAESRFGAMSDYLPLNSIYSVFKAVENKRAKFGVVPIENSRDGIVGETLDYLGESNQKIVAELTIPIQLSLASKCQKIKDIKRIYSKDKGFGQCRNFLIQHSLEDIEKIPVESTAKAAKLAMNDPQSAAICSHIASKLYNLPIMFDNIEDIHTNKTRFIILSDFKNQMGNDDKTTILAKLENRPGSLVGFLQEFDDSTINLMKIESRPSMDIEDNDFSSWFYIDFDGHYDNLEVQRILNRHIKEIKWLGSYAKGNNR